ncbi:MAG: hypothetical protein R3F60_03245 [bacterium]
MRRLLLAALLLPLAGCPPGQTPDPKGNPAIDPGWWRGTWVVDEARLLERARADGLSPDALAVASSLVHELAPAYAYEIGPDALRRQTRAGERILPARIRGIGPDAVEVDAGELRLRLSRGPGGPLLVDGGREVPVRRAAPAVD